MKKAKTSPVPVRLDDDLRGRLRRAAKRMGSNDSSVIRFAILTQLPHIEAGRITIAPAR
jgi:predicted transcriptional regulator